MAKGWLKNLLKGLRNNGFYVGKDGKWKPFGTPVSNFGPSASQIQDISSDAADFPVLEEVLASASDKFLETGLTAAEKEANEFSSQEAEKARQFESKQAELARDWNEEMYDKYNSLSGKIAQAEKAGVNPMFAVTGNSVSPIGTVSSTGSSSAPGSVSPSGHGLTDLIGAIMGAMKIKSEIDVNKSVAEKNIADANKTSKETSWIDSLSQAQLDNLVASKDELESRLGVNSATANKLSAEFSKLVQETARISQITDAEKKNLEAQTALANFQRESANTFKGLDVGSDVLNTVIDLAIALIERKTHLTLGR